MLPLPASYLPKLLIDSLFIITYHLDGICAFEGYSIIGLTLQPSLSGIQCEICIAQAKMEYKIGVTVTIDILLMSPGFIILFIPVTFRGVFKTHCGVIHIHNIEISRCEKGNGYDLLWILRVYCIRVVTRPDVDIHGYFRNRSEDLNAMILGLGNVNSTIHIYGNLGQVLL